MIKEEEEEEEEEEEDLIVRNSAVKNYINKIKNTIAKRNSYSKPASTVNTFYKKKSLL